MSDAGDQIRNLIYAYAHAIDTGNFERLAELFAHGNFRHHLDDDVDDPTSGKRGQDVAKHFQENVLTYDDGTPRTHHVTTNVQLEIDEKNGTAEAYSYLLTLQQISAGPIEIIGAAHYLDKFARVDGIWRFADRLVFRDFEGDMSRHSRSIGRRSIWKSEG